jgi:hypothetical protein
MPQLDKVTYFSQVTWLISSFALFYFIIVKRNLVDIAKILKLRNKATKSTTSSSEFLTFQDKIELNPIITTSTLKNTLKESNLILNEATSKANSLTVTSDNFDRSYLNTLVKLTLTRKGLIQLIRG